ncbi:hypothetical protein [Candidatus Nitrospira bockiana]
MRSRAVPRRLAALFAVMSSVLLVGLPALGVELLNDPGGFNGLPWEAPLAGRPDLRLVGTADHIETYAPTQEQITIGEVPMDQVRLLAVDGKFARVTARYHGRETHARLLAYLQRRYGPLDQIPGQMLRGLNQQYNWRGGETEINLTYQASTERGYLFIDSRALAPRFQDNPME